MIFSSTQLEILNNWVEISGVWITTVFKSPNLITKQSNKENKFNWIPHVIASRKQFLIQLSMEDFRSL